MKIRDPFDVKVRMAKTLSKSSLVPEAYRGPDGQFGCLLAIELASQLEVSAFTVITDIDPARLHKKLVRTLRSMRRVFGSPQPSTKPPSKRKAPK